MMISLASLAATTETQQVVDGIAIYLGVIPAEMIEGHPASHPEAQMHGGKPGGAHYYHVMVALFDSKSGSRITDAEVSATVSEIGLAGPTRKLEPMAIAGTITYGNYFEVRDQTLPYRIDIRIQRPGMRESTEAEFEYRFSPFNRARQ